VAVLRIIFWTLRVLKNFELFMLGQKRTPADRVMSQTGCSQEQMQRLDLVGADALKTDVTTMRSLIGKLLHSKTARSHHVQMIYSSFARSQHVDLGLPAFAL